MDYAIAQLDNEQAIAAEVVARLPALLPHDAVALLEVTPTAAKALATHGFSDAELETVEQWSLTHATAIAAAGRSARELRPGGTALLASGLPAGSAYLMLPLDGKLAPLRRLLLARQRGHFGAGWDDLGTILARQIGVVMDNAALFRQLADQARFDALTGACNRPWFRQQAEEACAARRRDTQPVSVLMLDLDNFKAINDSHGHAVGDAVLAGLVASIAGQLRSHDILCRYGGEEFVICLPQTDYAVALLTAERIRRAVADTPVATSAGPIRVTVSIGVSGGIPGVPSYLDGPITRADTAMYVAKQAGRNRVHGGN